MRWIQTMWVLSAATAIAAEGPQIVFEETKHDFGEVEPSKLAHEFKFRNTGDQTLEIEKVQAACGCTAVAVGETKIEPGREGTIRSELNTTTFKGAIQKGITVLSNDPKNRNVQLTLAAFVKTDLMVLPQQNVWFGNLRPDTTTNREVEIRSALKDPLVVEKVESSVSWLTARVVSATNQSVTLLIATQPPLPEGRQQAVVTVHTQYEKYRQVVINTSLNVPAPITVVPGRLTFLKNSNGPTARTVVVTRNDGADLHIVGVETANPALSSVLTTNQAGRSYRLNVTYTPKDGETPSAGKLVVKTDDPQRASLEIPVVFQ